MIHVTFGPEGPGKFLRGKVEVDGLDISNHVTGLDFHVTARGENHLVLDLILHGSDITEFEIPEEEITVRTKCIRDGEIIETSATGESARKYLRLAFDGKVGA